MVPDGPPHPGWDTRLVHAGEEIRVGGAIVMPIFQSAMFEESERIDDQLLYIRYTNLPNHRALQMKLAALEGAEDALLFASGMAAISTALLTVLKAGDHLLAQEGLYGGTHALLTQELPTLGIEVDFVRGDDLEQWERCRKPNTRGSMSRRSATRS
jgi:cystathionine gamma-synthase/cystathionine gamma-lyase/cystathionine beta-lyase